MTAQHTENFQKVTTGERRQLFWFAAFIMALTSLPYLVGFYQQGTEWHFTGFVFGSSDGNSYIAKMLSGAWGEWLFRTPYTAYPQNGIFLYFPYILIGKLAPKPLTHENLIFLYHLFRLAAGFLVIYATYDFSAIFIREIKWRKFATLLAVLGGGFGWISVFGLQSIFSWGLPLESYSPEAFGFLSIYGLPHLAIARALLLWGLRSFLINPNWFRSTGGWLHTGSLWVAIGFFQPIIQAVGLFVIIFFLITTAISQVVRKSKKIYTGPPLWWDYFRSAIAVAICGAPIVIYTFLIFEIEPLLQVWKNQNIIGSPAPLDYMLGYGVALPFSILGIRHLSKKYLWQGWIFVSWLLFAFIAVYGPLSLQRRFLDGLWVALSISAVYCVSQIALPRQKFALGWLALAFPMPLILLTAGFVFASNPSEPLFRPANEVNVFEYLTVSAQPWDVVLSSDETANPLPAWAPVRTLNGHGPESINGPRLREQIDCFYSSDCRDGERQDLLDEFDIDYIIWGPHERALGDWNLRQMPDLQLIYESGEYAVFQVANSP